MIKNQVFCAFAVVGFLACSVLCAEPQESVKALQQFRIKKDMPTVYVSFERAGKRKPLEQGESEEGVWLRLHNNTRWPITVAMNGVPKEYGDAGLFYEVVLSGKVIAARECHVCSSNQISPGSSVLFSVPAENLAENHAIRLAFSYAWEQPDDVFAGREPQHFVYFYSSKIPKSSQKSR